MKAFSAAALLCLSSTAAIEYARPPSRRWRACPDFLRLPFFSPGAAALRRTGVMQVGVQTFAASFTGDYTNPVVIAGVPTSRGDEEIVIRVTSIDTRTKTIQFCEPTPGRFPPLPLSRPPSC